MNDVASLLAENVRKVRDQIAAAAEAAGRSPEAVKLVAVTKYVGPAEAAALLAAGCVALGESRPQELWAKAAEQSLAAARWHLVGRLQRNKVERTLPLVELVHSVDSPRLLAAIEKAAGKRGQAAPVLLEVNCSGDQAKLGFTPEGVRSVVDGLSGYPHVQVCGLMTMAAREGGPDAARRNFAALRRLRDALAEQSPPEARWDELSMGMSGDFAEAIAEGSTLVRIGSVLFDGIAAFGR